MRTKWNSHIESSWRPQILILSPSYKKEDENGFNTDTSAGCKTANKTAAINGNAAISGVPN